MTCLLCAENGEAGWPRPHLNVLKRNSCGGTLHRHLYTYPEDPSTVIRVEISCTACGVLK
jgi:hypothetical protein